MGGPIRGKDGAKSGEPSREIYFYFFTTPVLTFYAPNGMIEHKKVNRQMRAMTAFETVAARP
jgi:hypothetical protein